MAAMTRVSDEQRAGCLKSLKKKWRAAESAPQHEQWIVRK
jgi:hypothetical protein